MIFVTVGTQLPFDRLLSAVESWANSTSFTGERIVAQIGPSSFLSSKMEVVQHLGVTDFKQIASECRIIVSHAGMGSILTAMSFEKPIAIMPRRASLGEHRNDHQLATAKRFGKRNGISVIDDGDGLTDCLDGRMQPAFATSPYASESLIDRLRGFIHGREPCIVEKESLRPEAFREQHRSAPEPQRSAG